MAASASLSCGFSMICRMYLLAGSPGLARRKIPVRAWNAMNASTKPRMSRMPNWRMGLFFREQLERGSGERGDTGLDRGFGQRGELARVQRGQGCAGALALRDFLRGQGAEAEHA